MCQNFTILGYHNRKFSQAFQLPTHFVSFFMTLDRVSFLFSSYPHATCPPLWVLWSPWSTWRGFLIEKYLWMCWIGPCKITCGVLMVELDFYSHSMYSLSVNWDFFVCLFGFIFADLKKVSSSNAAKSNLPKSGLRPPGYSRLPAAKLAAFGFMRSSSVSSVSSAQSADSAQPEPSRLANRKLGFSCGKAPLCTWV